MQTGNERMCVNAQNTQGWEGRAGMKERECRVKKADWRKARECMCKAPIFSGCSLGFFFWWLDVLCLATGCYLAFIFSIHKCKYSIATLF